MLWITIIGTILFWFGLYLSGFPRPMGDDLFFIGAAINLVKTGQLVNPLLSFWSTYTVDRFFVQPPFHSYTLAGWLMLTGINTQSFLLFQFFCYNTFSISAVLILRKYQFSWLSVMCIPIIYATWMANVGLRQDALGMAYLAIGLWCLTDDSPLRYFVGFSFLGLAMGTSPVLLAYAVPFSVGIMGVNLKQAKSISVSYWFRRVAVLLLAIATIFLLFLWAIDFELFHFLEDLSWHAQLRVPSLANLSSELRLVVTTGYGEVIYGSLYTIALVFLVLLVVNRKHPGLIYLITVLGVALIANLFLYSSTLYLNFNFFCWLGVVLVLFNLRVSHAFRLQLSVICLVTFLIYQSQAIVAILGQKKVPQSKYKSVLTWVQEHPNFDYYFVDDVAARFVFDYDLPERAIDWSFSGNHEVGYPLSIRQKVDNTVWIISRAKAALTPDLPDYERVTLIGVAFTSVPRSPHQVMIVE